MRIRYWAALPLLLTAMPALAQDGPVIVVTGRGLPETPASPAYGTIELDREKITSSASGRIDDVLGAVSGFQQFRRSDSRSTNPTSQGATLRALGGNATSRALVLLDGVPLADPFFGYIPYSAVAPERLERIRVTRGGGSGPFGAGALAGTIEMESGDPTSLGLLSGQALVNQRGETELSATAAPQIGEGFAAISGRWDRGQGFHTTPKADRVDATSRAAFDSWSASGRLVQPMGENLEIQFRGLAFEDHRTLRFQGADSSTEGKDFSMRLVSHGAWQVDALVYAQWRNFTNRVISSSNYNLTLDQKDTPSRGVGGKLEVRPPIGAGHTLRIGTDFRRSEGDLYEDAYNASTGALTQQRFAGGVNTDFGLFIEDDWQIGPVILTGGVRADRYRIANGYYHAYNTSGAPGVSEFYDTRADWEFSYRAGALVNATDTVQLRAAAYSGLRLPTLNELYRPFVVFPVTTEANAALEIERLEGFEAGIDWEPLPGITVGLTAFDNKVKDAVANVTIDTNTRQRRNVDAIEAQGIEFAAGVDFGVLMFDSTVVYTDAKMRGTGPAADLDGFRPAQTPRWAASATIGFRPDIDALMAITLRYVGDQFEDDQQQDVLPGATTIDLFAQVPLRDRLSFVGRVENLFDKNIVTRNQGGSIDYGPPLTVWAGLRYGF